MLILLQSCGNDTHPDVELLREKRIRSYFYSRTISENCLGSSVFSIETYLIIDNATDEDAGRYIVNVTSLNARVFSAVEEVTVIVGMCIFKFVESNSANKEQS